MKGFAAKNQEIPAREKIRVEAGKKNYSVNSSNFEADDELKAFIESLKGCDYSKIMELASEYSRSKIQAKTSTKVKFQIPNSMKFQIPNKVKSKNHSSSSSSKCSSSSTEEDVSSTTINPKVSDDDVDNKIFDYIIVGSGPAGAVIANNLFKAGYTVLMLEAGDDNSQETNIKTVVSSGGVRDWSLRYEWQGETFPQQQGGGVIYGWKNGRTIGGGSSINGFQVVDSVGGDATYWDELASVLGDPKWNSTNITNIRKKLETFTPFGFAPHSTRGTNGPLQITTYPQIVAGYDEEILANLFSAYFGLPIVDDYNLKSSPAGCVHKRTQFTVNYTTGHRESSDVAFLREFLNVDGYGIGDAQDLFRLVLNATVVRLITKGKRIEGVEYTRYGHSKKVYAEREVILSTNINTTQLLQHSGIGPSSVLINANEEVLANSIHCGRHLKNHLLMVLLWSDAGGVFTGVPNPTKLAFGYNAGMFQEFPAYVPAGKRAVQWITTVIPGGPPILLLAPMFLLPYSDGSVEIQNQDPLKTVRPDPNYFNDNNGNNVFPPPTTGNSATNNSATSIDFALFVKALQDMRDCMLANGFTAISPALADYNNPAKLRALTFAARVQAHHWANECRMGNNINDGVCDSRGRVFGVEKLRIASASILPEAPGNMQMPSYFCGQKIAEDILDGN